MFRTPVRTAAAAASHPEHPALEPQLAVVPNFMHVPVNSAGALEAYMHLYVDGAAHDEATLDTTEGRSRLN